MKPFSIRSFPRAIVHFDGDAFFASVEQARDHTLKGLPVATGAERNIIAAFSYEAKRAGVVRGMTIREAKKVCPNLVVLNSDFELYSAYARRMYAIARRFTPEVEEYSIDECFADITGMRSYHRMSYEDIARAIKDALECELGITFGVGLGPNKSVAKLASKWNKPAGFTVIPARKIHEFLGSIPIAKVWGIGSAMSVFFEKHGVKTALDFALKEQWWLRSMRLAKPYWEIWHEFHGLFVKQLATHVSRGDIGSIVASRTFTPASSDARFVFSELSKNIEEACRRARFHGVRARTASIYLKRDDFSYTYRDVPLPSATNAPDVLLASARAVFDDMCVSGERYRTSGVVFGALTSSLDVQGTLFDSSTEDRNVRAHETVFRAVDALNAKYGRRSVLLASSARAVKYRERDKSRARDGVHGVRGRGVRFHELPFLGVAR